MACIAVISRCAVSGAAWGCVLSLTVSGCSSAAPTVPPSPLKATTPTTQETAETNARPTTSVPSQPEPPSAGSRGSATVTKVLVFIEENHSLSQMTAQMPYTYSLAQRFGYATSYTAIRHPSLPNYLAIAGGQTYGITNDDPPSANPVSGTSVFGQAVASGRTAAVYADGMPQNCAISNGGNGYAVKHNPWAYFVNERSICQRYDVPADRLGGAITAGTLPNVGMVVPNLCNDAHDCPLSTADTWFRGWMTRIFEGPDWKSGHLAVVLTADEDDKSAANTVLTVVIHPSLRSKVVGSPLNHYSLTRFLQDVAGTAPGSNAASAPSMTTAFGLPLR